MLHEMDVATDVLIEFFEVAIHGILRARSVYPSGIFVKRKKYGVPVYASIHPDLNSYITKCLSSIKPLLERKSLKCIAISLSNENEVVERFVFEMSDLCATLDSCDDFLMDERVFRAFCLKIGMSNELLPRIHEGCSFIVQVHTDSNTVMDLRQHGSFNEDFPWIVSEWKQRTNHTCEVIPLKSAKTSLFNLQLLVERRTNR